MSVIEEYGLENEIIELYNKGLNIRQIYEELLKKYPEEEVPSKSTIFRFITSRQPKIELKDITTDDIQFVSTKILERLKRAYSDISGKSLNSRATTRFMNTYMKDVKADLNSISDKVLQREKELKEWKGQFLYQLWLDVLLPTFEAKYDNTTKDIIAEVRQRYEDKLLEFLRKDND